MPLNTGSERWLCYSVMNKLSKRRVLVENLGEGALGLVHYAGNDYYNIILNGFKSEKSRKWALEKAHKIIDKVQPKESFYLKYCE